MTADEALRDLWDGLRDSHSGKDVAFVQGAVAFARMTGAISQEMAELWWHRIKTCPGHDNEGGRDWCAYCGTISQDTTKENADVH